MATPLVNPEAIRIDRLFPTPVARLAYPDHATLNPQLLAQIQARRQAQASTSHSNNGGWQSTDDFPAWAGEPGQTLLAFATAMANQLSAVNSPEHGLIEPQFEWSCADWANINRPGDSNNLHGHPGAYWSAVYWVDDGGRAQDDSLGGELEFPDPRGLITSMLAPALRMRIEGCLTAGFSQKYAPTAGTLVMFPSWLMHAVRPWHGSRERVSIAFNFGV